MSGLFDQLINYSPPSLLLGTVTYKGTWSAATNTPTLANPPSSITNGNYYVVDAAGTEFGLSFNIGDWIISNGAAWEKVDNTDAVSSVFGRMGAVVGVSTDYSAVGITNTALGASNPSTVAATTITATSTIAATGAVTGSNLSGTNTGDQTITLTGDVTGSGTGSFAATLATVNANVGSFGSATAAPTFTVNGKGLLTAAGSATVTPAVGSITGLGTGVATFLGTPSSANLAAAVTDETGTGALVFASSPTLVTPTLGAATATSINGVTVTGTSTPALSVTGTTAVSGTNTGDQTTITGNAGSATILETARLINGVSFNGSADITVTAAAGTLTGATLASGVTASSLTSLGTIASLTATALTVNDNSTLGSSNTDTVNFNARVASDINPATDDTYDLGVTGHEWRNLNIDGTANIDSLVADTADINGGTIDGTTIGAGTASTGAFTTLSSTTGANFATSSGSVGIGTASPTLRFDCRLGTPIANPTFLAADVAVFGNDSGNNTVVQILSANDKIGQIQFSDPDARARGAIAYAHASDSMQFNTAAATRLTIDSGGNVGIGTTSPASKLDVVGTIRDAIGDVRLIPQNSRSAAYTLVLDDAGKHLLHPSADTTARTFTIPANGSVAYPIGTAITFVNQASAGVLTIAITTDTMRLAGAGTTGSRTLAANGIATCLKLTATEWIISGTGLT